VCGQANRIPLGATWDGKGVNFALFSAHAEKVELCLFDSSGQREIERLVLPENTDQIWHGYVPGCGRAPSMAIGFLDPYEPQIGHRFNHHKLLLDPYAKQFYGVLHLRDEHCGYQVGHGSADLSFDNRDNAREMLKCVVVDTSFNWEGRPSPQIPLVANADLRNPRPGLHHPPRGDAPSPARHVRRPLPPGNHQAICKSLGITAVELMPVHAFVDDRFLTDRGLRNYWGYNTLCFFAPEPRYLSSGDLAEFKTMIKRLHDAGIEVLLDVVYNHTAEGDQMGPTLSFRGIDNASYYRLHARQPPLLHQRHRLRQHPQPDPSPGFADGDGQPALLGQRHACGRFPLRSGGDLGSRRIRIRPLGRLLSTPSARIPPCRGSR
jgi:isoamylase